MKQTKIDTTCILNIKGEEARFKVVDAVNSTIREINSLNLTVAQAMRVLKVLEIAITESIDNSKIEVGEIVYCDHYGRPKQRP